MVISIHDRLPKSRNAWFMRLQIPIRTVIGKLQLVSVKAAISLILFGVVATLVVHYYSASSLLDGLHKLTAGTISFILAMLLANSLAAALRFEVIAGFTGHRIGFSRAMAAVGASSLAGAVFFQIAGQLIARGLVARRGGMPFAAVVVVTAYERIVAAILSGLLALAGAWFIFGKVYLDQSSGGADLIKIMSGLVMAMTGGALLGYGPLAVRNIVPLMTRHFVQRCLAAIGLTLLVQAPMMIAYVVSAHVLSPQTSISDLIAASAIVMFAASVPISLAGWGVREMSAIIALGAIGVAGPNALTAAVIVGAGSMLAMAVITVLSLPRSTADSVLVEHKVTNSINYSYMLGWIVPIIAAVFVLFQIYVPIGSGLLNVNLADPVAILGAALLVLRAVKNRATPRWQVDYVNIYAVAATLALGIGLLIGAARFGWTDWALINRFVGWFVLLSFAATGALAVVEGGNNAFRIFLLTYIGAAAAVTLLETVIAFLDAAGVWLPPRFFNPSNAVAFAQNHNFFAFQLLMALAAGVVILRGTFLRICILAILSIGFWIAASRSGWIAAAFVFAASIYLGRATIGEIAKALTIAALAIVFSAALAFVLSTIFTNHRSTDVLTLVPNFLPTDVSTHERVKSIVGGLKLFVEHPIFGAGLGAFRNQMVPLTAPNAIPLLIHSTAVWLLAEMGIVGFLAFAIPGIRIWATEWARAPKVQSAAVAALCILAFAVMSGPADMVYQRTFWLLLGAALAMPSELVHKPHTHSLAH